MENRIRNLNRLNVSITKKVIELQEQGYDCDFLLLANGSLQCMQTNLNYPLSTVAIKQREHGYDFFSQSYKNVHTIETGNGEKGVLLTEKLF
ncbi:hypothetical protein IM793_19965 [Pedobacter sp. MR2016-19]|jgi:hypothetical protein|uniref:Uncharacterized protein n=1 Tax=Pedobacter alluvionis TaxID=475253 RepID=A0A497YKY8_9SPHI|nr:MULTISPECIES: hypothetical protein [Pedobacter]MBE5321450.1 hypothetical protein [Pedobacter sp. MR2016-19]RLJ80740.1 hypothetical protein BCL90_1539 [Pedobacter alluvionis]TFB31988.1 hypothetical protein E3V97_15600 [Pedobacter alluvionis]